MNVKTDEEIIEMIVSYQAEHKEASRTDLLKLTGVSRKRLQLLAAEGHFKFPPPMSRKIRHLKGSSKWATNFQLPNSPIKG